MKLADNPIGKVGTPKGVVNNPQGLGGKSGKKAEIDNPDYANINPIQGKTDTNTALSDPKSKYGTSSDYLIRRIVRDRPDILERMQQGEFPSVRAAAIEAGIIKKNKRISVPADPAKAAIALGKRFKGQDRILLIETLLQQLDGPAKAANALAKKFKGER